MRSTSPLLLSSLAAALAVAAAPRPAAAGPAPGKRTPEALQRAAEREQANSDAELARKRAHVDPTVSGGTKPASEAPKGRPAAALDPALLFTSPAPGMVRGEAGGLVLEATEAGVRLHPTEGPLDREDLAIGLVLRAVRAGEAAVFERGARAAASPRLAAGGRALSYAHAPEIEERYEALRAGFEQTFVLAGSAALASGADVTLEVAFETTLVPAERPGGDLKAISFGDGDRAVLTYGEALAIDAAGSRRRVPVRLAGDALEIVLDGAWLAGARFPITVDPLLTSMFISVTTSIDNERNADVAYSRTSDVYMVVWEDEYASDDHDIVAAIYSPSGGRVAGPFYIDGSTDDSLHPSVAWSPNGDRFLVAWQDDANSLFGGYDIWGALVSAQGVPGAPFEIYASLSGHSDPHVGAEDAANGRFIVAWTLNFASLGDMDVEAIYVDASGQVGSIIDVDTDSVDSWGATVNKVGIGATPFLVTWFDDRVVAGDEDVWARTVNAAGGLGPMFDVAFSTSDERYPSVAQNATGTEWCVAYDRILHDAVSNTDDWDVLAQRAGTTAKIGGTYPVAISFSNEYQPAVAFTAPAGGAQAEYLIAFATDEVSPINVRADRVTTGLVTIESDVVLGAPVTSYPEKRPAAAGRMGAAKAEYLVAWQRDLGSAAAPDWDIGAAVIGAPPPPVADFTATPRTGTAPLTVGFTDLSTGSIASRAWDFQNDGVVDSTLASPIFTYTQAGTYAVKLTVTGPGGTDTEVKTAFITVQPGLAADFTASPTSGGAPLAVKFTDRSVGGATAWAWDFDSDGVTDSTLQNPTFTYTAPGVYSVKLTVTGASGTSSLTKASMITVSAATPPVAAFDATPLMGAAPLTVAFTDRSTGTVTTWAWVFGDGAIDATQNPTHTFTAPGTYTVALTASGPAGYDTIIKKDLIVVGGSTGGGSASSPGQVIKVGSGGGGGGGCAFSGGSPADAAGALLPLAALAIVLAAARRQARRARA
jgi:PKD repeat protein